MQIEHFFADTMFQCITRNNCLITFPRSSLHSICPMATRYLSKEYELLGTSPRSICRFLTLGAASASALTLTENNVYHIAFPLSQKESHLPTQCGKVWRVSVHPLNSPVAYPVNPMSPIFVLRLGQYEATVLTSPSVQGRRFGIARWSTLSLALQG